MKTIIGKVSNRSEQELESDIAKILQLRYNDGLLCLPAHQPESLFKTAKEKGFIDQGGYLTRKGRYLLAKYPFR